MKPRESIAAANGRGLFARFVASAVLTAVLRLALSRATEPSGSSWSVLVPSFYASFDTVHWVFVIGVAGACSAAIATNRPSRIYDVHLWAVALGACLTLSSLGARPGDHVDPRLILAIYSGHVTLLASYLCLCAYAIAELTASVRRRRRES